MIFKSQKLFLQKNSSFLKANGLNNCRIIKFISTSHLILIFFCKIKNRSKNNKNKKINGFIIFGVLLYIQKIKKSPNLLKKQSQICIWAKDKGKKKFQKKRVN